MSLRDVAADHDHRRVEEVDGARQHLAQRPAGIANHADRAGMTAADETDDVATAGHVLARRGESVGECLTAGDCLQAADVPASADHVLAVRDLDVADVPRRSAGASVDVPVRNDAATDPGSSLHG